MLHRYWESHSINFTCDNYDKKDTEGYSLLWRSAESKILIGSSETALKLQSCSQKTLEPWKQQKNDR